MAIPLLVTTGTTVEVVYTGDPCVDAPKGSDVDGDAVDRWVLSSEAVCKVGADLVRVRAMNGEERWLASGNDGPAYWYYLCDTGVVSLNGEVGGLREWIRSLPITLAVRLAEVVQSVTLAKPLPGPLVEEATPEGEPFRAAG